VLEFISSILAALRASFRGRGDSALEILALRQQLAVFKRKHPRPSLSPFDRLFWTILRGFWSGWAEALIIVKPETVARWHRAALLALALACRRKAEDHRRDSSHDQPHG
jgi:hypothetical protein